MVVKKRKLEVMDFTIDVSNLGNASSSEKPKASALKKKVDPKRRAERATSSTTKVNKRKTKGKMFDEEMAVLGLDPDELADSEDFEAEPRKVKTKTAIKTRTKKVIEDVDVDDGMLSTRPRPQKVIKKKKRVKPAGTSLALTPMEKPKISKIDRRKVKSIVGDDADRMLTMLEDDTSLDAAMKLIKRRLLQTMIDMIPQLETSMRDSNGRYGAHALNGSIQTIRELIIDLEAAQDRGAVGEALVEKVIRPAVLEVATKIVEEHATVLSEIKDLIEPHVYDRVRQAQIDSRNRVASSLNSKYEDMRSETIGFLQR